MSRANNILAATAIVLAALLMTYIDRPDLFHGHHGFGRWGASAAPDWMQDTYKGNDGPYVKIMADVKHMAVTHTLTSKDLDTYYRNNQADTGNPENAFKWAYACYLAGRYVPAVTVPEPNSELALNIADDPNTYSYNRLHYLLTPPTALNCSNLAAIGNNILKTRSTDYQVEEHLIDVLMSSKIEEWQLEALTHAHNIIRQRPRDPEAYKGAADAIYSMLDQNPPYDAANAIEARNLYRHLLAIPGFDPSVRSDVSTKIQSLQEYITRAGNDPSLIKVCSMSFDPDNPEVGAGIGPSVVYGDKGIAHLPPPDRLATTPGDKSMLLTWSLVPGARGYAIYHLDGLGIAQRTIVTAPGTCSYVDSDLKNGAHYTYVISTLYGSSSISKPSAAVSGTPVSQPGKWRVKQTPASSTRPAIWLATWIPDGSGRWPSLLSVALGEHRTVTSITKVPPIAVTMYTGMYPPEDFSAYWTAPETGAVLYCGSGKYESDDEIYAATSSPNAIPAWLEALFLHITGRSLSAPPAVAVTWNRTAHSDISNEFYYSQPYLKRHFGAPSEIKVAVPVIPVSLDGVSGPPDTAVMTAQ